MIGWTKRFVLAVTQVSRLLSLANTDGAKSASVSTLDIGERTLRKDERSARPRTNECMSVIASSDSRVAKSIVREYGKGFSRFTERSARAATKVSNSFLAWITSGTTGVSIDARTMGMNSSDIGWRTIRGRRIIKRFASIAISDGSATTGYAHIKSASGISPS